MVDGDAKLVSMEGPSDQSDVLREVRRLLRGQRRPPMAHFRVDPFDNQSGEIERVDAAEGFTGRVVDGDAKLVGVEDLPL